MHPDQLLQAIEKGQIRAAARLMRLIDDRAPSARPILSSLMKQSGQAYILGVTGNPGSGKSTLVNQLIHRFRDLDLSVGCIAIDPTSPFSGGAILGDRVRMQDHAGDPDVFIRSVATRGHLGGLSRSTPAMVQVMDAMGYDIVIVETVGVGQDEVEIVRLADTSLVVLVPGLGDDIQADKAGLMEIADIFVLNKSDLPGSKQLRRQITTMLSLNRQSDSGGSPPPIHTTRADQGQGMDDLMHSIERRRAAIEHGPPRRRRQASHLVRAIARTEWEFLFQERIDAPDFSTLVDRVSGGELDPYSAAEFLLKG